MSQIAVLPAEDLQKLFDSHHAVTRELIETKKELADLQGDGYVSWEWVTEYLGVNIATAKAMLAEEKILVYGTKVKRIRKSVVIRYAEKHSVRVKSVQS